MMQLGFAPVAKADGHRRAFTRPEGVEQDRHTLGVDAVDVVEHQRRPILAADIGHQRLQFVIAATRLERHVDVLQLTVFFQQREVFAHVLERHGLMLLKGAASLPCESLASQQTRVTRAAADRC